MIKNSDIDEMRLALIEMRQEIERMRLHTEEMYKRGVARIEHLKADFRAMGYEID